MPVVRRLEALDRVRGGSRAGRSGSRRPGALKNSRPTSGQDRVAEVACAAAAWRPGSMPPRKRLPMTRSSPSRSSVDERAEAREVVAVVGVAHDDVAAAGGRDAAEQGGAVAALGHVDDARALGRRRSPASRRCCRCRRRSPRRARPSVSRKRQRLAGCTSASVSASFRHGITIESSIGAVCCGVKSSDVDRGGALAERERIGARHPMGRGVGASSDLDQHPGRLVAAPGRVELGRPRASTRRSRSLVNGDGRSRDQRASRAPSAGCRGAPARSPRTGTRWSRRRPRATRRPDLLGECLDARSREDREVSRCVELDAVGAVGLVGLARHGRHPDQDPAAGSQLGLAQARRRVGDVLEAVVEHHQVEGARRRRRGRRAPVEAPLSKVRSAGAKGSTPTGVSTPASARRVDHDPGAAADVEDTRLLALRHAGGGDPSTITKLWNCRMRTTRPAARRQPRTTRRAPSATTAARELPDAGPAQDLLGIEVDGVVVVRVVAAPGRRARPGARSCRTPRRWVVEGLGEPNIISPTTSCDAAASPPHAGQALA